MCVQKPNTAIPAATPACTTVIGVIQLAAFVYGVYAVANNRPAYVVFVGDRIEVVSAGEIDDADLAQGAERYRTLPQWGPQLVAIQEPQDPKERENMIFSGLAGKDYAVLPIYYVSYEQKVQEIRQRSLPVSELEKRHPESKPMVSAATAQLQTAAGELVWLPVKHKSGFWTALLDPQTGRLVHWLPIDPY